jgi:hypothetical protein
VRHVQWLVLASVMASLVPAPARGAIAWIPDGLNAFGSGLSMYNVDYHVVIASDPFVFVAAPGIIGGDTDHVFVQKFDRCGAKLWGTNGIVPDTGGATIGHLDMVADGLGGVIVAWYVQEFLYVQRLDADGIALWTAGGVIVDSAGGPPHLVGDNAGGALVFYHGASDNYVHAQRLDASGALALGANGVRVSNHAAAEVCLEAVADTGGGTAPAGIVAYRQLGTNAVYLQKIDGGGTRLWGVNGASMTTPGEFNQSDQSGRLASDEAGGAWIAYEVENGSVVNIRAVRVTNTGSIANSYSIGSANEFSTLPKIAYVGGGKAHLAWWAAYTTGQVLITELGSSLDAHFLAPGSAERVTDLVADGTGGSVAVWEHEVGGFHDVHAARYHPASGTIFPWGNNVGVPVCAAAGAQQNARVARAGTGATGDYYFVWNDSRVPAASPSIYVQRVDGASGVWGHPEVKIVASVDCDGDDEGGCLRLEWHKSQLDGHPIIHPQDPVTKYSIWRAVDQMPMYPPDPICPQGVAVGEQQTSCEWEWIMEVAADGIETYAATVPTTRDASPGDPAIHFYAILAESESGEYYASVTGGSASHDEIPPEPPTVIDGEWIGSYIYVAWSPSSSPDAVLYRVYHAERHDGTSWGPWVQVGESADTSYTHTNANPSLQNRYQASAVDDAGNEGVPSSRTTVSANPTPVDGPGAAPSALRIIDAAPNPFSGATALRIGVPARAEVEIDVFDARGRRVRHETTPSLAAGWHTLRFDGRDSSENRLPSGVYFYRVRTGTESATRKVVLMR